MGIKFTGAGRLELIMLIIDNSMPVVANLLLEATSIILIGEYERPLGILLY